MAARVFAPPSQSPFFLAMTTLRACLSPVNICQQESSAVNDSLLKVDVVTTRRLLVQRATLLKLLRIAGIDVPDDAVVRLPTQKPEDLEMQTTVMDDAEEIAVEYSVTSQEDFDSAPRRKPKS